MLSWGKSCTLWTVMSSGGDARSLSSASSAFFTPAHGPRGWEGAPVEPLSRLTTSHPAGWEAVLVPKTPQAPGLGHLTGPQERWQLGLVQR